MNYSRLNGGVEPSLVTSLARPISQFLNATYIKKLGDRPGDEAKGNLYHYLLW